MAAECLAAIRLCIVRVTLLEQDGSPAAGPDNVYVSNSPITLGVTPEIEEGDDKTLKSGCGCIVATYKGLDSLKRFTLELDLGKIEPGLLSMLIGADTIEDGTGDPIGLWWAGQLTCDDDPVAPVAFEGWQTAWDGGGPAVSPHQYVHWIWPYTRWQIGTHTLEDEFFQPKVNGFSLSSNGFGSGIFGDLPETVGPLGGFFYDDTIPDAECGFQTESIT